MNRSLIAQNGCKETSADEFQYADVFADLLKLLLSFLALTSTALYMFCIVRAMRQRCVGRKFHFLILNRCGGDVIMLVIYIGIIGSELLSRWTGMHFRWDRGSKVDCCIYSALTRWEWAALAWEWRSPPQWSAMWLWAAWSCSLWPARCYTESSWRSSSSHASSRRG